jgi:WD40 repeat protein
MNKIFVSYSRRNKNFAERIARDLSDAGLEVWIDFRQIHAGEHWQDEIFRGIERSDIIVVCLSPAAVVSEWVQREVNAAREQGKLIIPVMAVDAYKLLTETENMRWLLDVHFIIFENRYEEAFPELLDALPGKRQVGTYDIVDVENIPNPFKGLEAFQQTDAHFFFGRDKLITKSLRRLQQDRDTRFLAVVGASGSGKSSLVRAGVLPELRGGVLPGSEKWRMLIFTPGTNPVEALAQRLSPLLEARESDDIEAVLHESIEHFDVLVDQILINAPPEARLLLIVDQFEEVFTRSGEIERKVFLDVLNRAVTAPNGRALVLITMRADFFDHLSHYPALAELFEQENLVIVTEMTPAELLQSIEGPATAVGLVYDTGLPQRILDEVRRQPGSLPLLQYALKELYLHREGNRLTTKAYDEIGGVQKALAGHAESIYVDLGAAEQAIMRRVLLQLVEVGETGESTRRKVDRADLQFRDVPEEAVSELIEKLTSAESRLLIASRQITASEDEVEPTVWIEVGHEALIRQWDRFTGWVAENQEDLRYGTEFMQAAQDWRAGNQDKSYLLMGNRLIRAEAWLQEADATELQREFIQASMVEGDRQAKIREGQMETELRLQRQAANRLRGLIGLMFLALVVAVALTFWALDSQSRANTAKEAEQVALLTAIANERLALENEQEAISLALASGADRAIADDDRELAVLLAVEANDMEDPPPQAQRTLAEVAYTPSTRFLIDEGENIAIADAAFNPDGTMVFYAAEQRLVLWDVTTGEVIHEFATDAEVVGGHTDTIRCVAFGPDGTQVASAGDDGLLIIWDVATGAVVRQFTAGDGINSISFNPDGTMLLAGSDDDLIILWDVTTGTEVRRYTGHDGAVNSVIFSADGEFILSGSDDDTARLWDVTTGAVIQEFIGHDGDVTSVVFHEGGDYIITGSDDNTVRRWNVETAELNRTYEGHDDDVNRIALSPDGETMVSASDDGSVIWWRIGNGDVLDTFTEHTDTVLDVAFSPEGDYLLSTAEDGTARLWDIKDAEAIHLYDSKSPEEIFARVVVGAYGLDGQVVVSSGPNNTLLHWDTVSGFITQQFVGHTDAVQDVAMSEDGSTVLSASADQTVILWDVETGQAIYTFAGHESVVRTLSYLPGDTQAVSAAADGGLILWDLTTGEMVRRYGPLVEKGDIGHSDMVYDVAVSPNGLRMLSASADGALILWDIENGSIIEQYKGHNDAIRAVAFDSTGERAVSGAANGTLIVWDMTEDTTLYGGVVRRLTAHDRAIYSIDFSPDDDNIITGSHDQTLRLWDSETGFELRRYTSRNKQTFRSVDFRSDGLAVLTGMSDATLIEWRVLIASEDLLAWTFANRFVRQPTCDEREQYRLQPQCVEGSPTPTITPVPTQPAAEETPIPLLLSIGITATVNTNDGDPLNVRDNPNTEAEIVAQLVDGAIVTLVDGPVFDATSGYSWWLVEAADGASGWVVESVPEESLQTLVP